jgi:hypothetical protein
LIEPTLRPLTLFYDLRGWLPEGLEVLGRAAAVLDVVRGPVPPAHCWLLDWVNLRQRWPCLSAAWASCARSVH